MVVAFAIQTAEPCRICQKLDCDDDCEELAAIYREHRREQLRDIELDDDDRLSSFYSEEY